MYDIEAFYFPTKIVLIDDNQSFLDNFGLKISDSYPLETYSDPNKALKSIKADYQNNALSKIEDIIIQKDEEEDNDSSFTIELDQLKLINQNQKRHDVISVIVVDYSMPELNGIDFCRQIKHLPIPKIMLTGHADFKLVLKAFNEKIIDQFIVKDSTNMYENLMDSIIKSQHQFFYQKSYPILNSLSVNHETLLKTNEHNDCLKEVINRHQIKEYYLIDPMGSYLLIDDKGNEKFFFVLNDRIFEQYLDIAKHAGAPQTIITSLKKRTHAPIFMTEEDRKLEVSQWTALLRPFKKFGNLYYSFIE